MSSIKQSSRVRVEASLGKRRRREMFFRAFGMSATLVGVFFLVAFFWTLIAQGSSAFVQNFVELDIEFSEEALAPNGELELEYRRFRWHRSRGIAQEVS